MNPIPGTPLLASNKSTRLAEANTLPLADGVTAVQQITKTGDRSFITHSDSREILYLKDAFGRGCYFYRSFAGTSGKAQFQWYPVGGVLADRRGEPAWIIKGSLRTDPGYGRPALDAFRILVNEVLPHSDQETDRLIEALTGVKSDFSWSNPHECKPVIQCTVPVTEDWKVYALEFWKLNGLNKVWGRRQER